MKVRINKSGIENTEKTVAAHKAPDPVTYTVSANGTANTANSTAIAFAFDKEVTGLAASAVTVTADTGTVTKGTLTGNGTNWSLGITVTTAGNVKVRISKAGIEDTVKNVTVHKQGQQSPVSWTAQANGASGTTASTKIDFTFSAAVTGLTAAEIAVTAGTGTVTKGSISGSGTKWSLGITVNTAGNVKVAINKAGIESAEKNVAVYKAPDPVPAATWIAQANGEANTANSTAIAFTFDKAVTGLTAADITVTNGTGNAAKGSLSGSGKNWSLGITVTGAGDITVTINKSGIESGPKTVTVHKQGEVTPDPVTYGISANGAANTTNSTAIAFAFAEAVTGLTVSHITVTADTGSVTTGTLSGSGTSWSLGITAVTTAGNVKVAINKSGIESAEKVVAVHKAGETADITWAAEANGTANSATSTAIVFTFSEAVSGLVADDITVGGSGSVSKGDLAETAPNDGTKWSLALTDVATAGNVSVSINKAGIASEAQDVAVYKAADDPAPDTTWTAQADGEADTADSSKIDFTFSAAVAGLTAADIAVTDDTGAVTKGSLTGSDTSWSLAVTVTAAGDVKVKINKTGIEDTEKNVAVYKEAGEEPSLEPEPAENFTYVKENDNTTITIQKYTGSNTDIIIPGTIENLPVTKLYSQAFINLKNKLTSVVIPNTVTVIEGTVFYNNSLTSANLPSGLTSIGTEAFYKNSLISVIIPDSVINLNATAFRNNMIETVVIGNGVVEIGNNAFNDNKIISLTFGSKVSTIGTSAFNTNNLVTLTIPDTVTIIGTNAFANNKLSSVTIGTGVTEIKAGAFRYNPDLASITFLGSVATLGNNVFKDTSALSSVTFNGTITTLTQNGSNSTFPGNLGDVYVNASKATGTYVSSDNGATWTKQN